MKNETNLLISSLETYYAENGKREIYHKERRDAIHQEFPHVVVVEGCCPTTDNAHRWCWDHFGPHHGKCEWEHNSEYPGCPLVRATEVVTHGETIDDGKSWPWADKNYHAVPPHDHEGPWSSFWLGKTDYDYGFTEFCFKNEADRDAFVEAAPGIGLGDRYDKENK